MNLKNNVTEYFTCSERAGKWLFGKKVSDSGTIKILNNAKNIYKYRITINLKEIKDNNILNNLNSYKTVNEQLKYFKEHEINCKIEKN